MFEIDDDMSSPGRTLAENIEIFTQFLRHAQRKGSAMELNPILLVKLKELHSALSDVLDKTSQREDKVAAWVRENNVGGVSDDEDSDDQSVVSTASTFAMPSSLLRVSCQLCTQGQNDLFDLAEHLSKNCSVINHRNYKEGRALLSGYLIIAKNLIKCNACNAVVKDLPKLMQHRESEEHIAKNEHQPSQTTFLYCTKCCINVPDNNLQYENHIYGEPHLKRCQETQLSVPKLLREGVHFTFKYEKNRNPVRCLICQVSKELSVDQIELHKLSLSHLEGLNDLKMKANTAVKCILCDVKIDSLFEFRKHLENPSHKTKTEQNRKGQQAVKDRICIFCDEILPSFELLVKHQEKPCSKISEMRRKPLMAEEVFIPCKCLPCDFETGDPKAWSDHKVSKGHHVKSQKTAAKGKSKNSEKLCLICRKRLLTTQRGHERHSMQHYLMSYPEAAELEEETQKTVILKGFQVDKPGRLIELKTVLEFFGKVDDLQAKPNGTVAVRYKTKESAEKVIHMSKITFHGQDIYFQRMEVEDAGKKKSAANSAVPNPSLEKGAAKSSSTDDLYKLTAFDKRYFSSQEAVLKASKKFSLLSKTSNSNVTEYQNTSEIVRQLLGGLSCQIVGSRAYNATYSNETALDIFLEYPLPQNKDKSSLETVKKKFAQLFAQILEASGKFIQVKQISSNFANVPTIECRLAKSSLQCNIIFGPHHVTEKSELIKGHISSDERTLPLILLIKCWAMDKELIGRDKFTGFALTMMIIFFLENVGVLSRTIFENPLLNYLNAKDYDTYGSAKKLSDGSCSELFYQFFSFYKHFIGFKKQVICLPLSKVILKTDLREGLSQIFNGCAISLMDPYDPTVNLTKTVSKETLQKFLGYASTVVSTFQTKA